MKQRDLKFGLAVVWVVLAGMFAMQAFGEVVNPAVETDPVAVPALAAKLDKTAQAADSLKFNTFPFSDFVRFAWLTTASPVFTKTWTFAGVDVNGPVTAESGTIDGPLVSQTITANTFSAPGGYGGPDAQGNVAGFYAGNVMPSNCSFSIINVWGGSIQNVEKSTINGKYILAETIYATRINCYSSEFFNVTGSTFDGSFLSASNVLHCFVSGRSNTLVNCTNVTVFGDGVNLAGKTDLFIMNQVPVSATGLPTGAIWRDASAGNVLKSVP